MHTCYIVDLLTVISWRWSENVFLGGGAANISSVTCFYLRTRKSNLCVCFFPATSTGRPEGLVNPHEGACLYSNMKLTIRVCCETTTSKCTTLGSGITKLVYNLCVSLPQLSKASAPFVSPFVCNAVALSVCHSVFTSAFANVLPPTTQAVYQEMFSHHPLRQCIKKCSPTTHSGSVSRNVLPPPTQLIGGFRTPPLFLQT